MRSEISKRKPKKIAKAAFDDAMERMDETDTKNFNETTATLKMLRENLLLWEGEEAEDAAAAAEEEQ
jgi:hypothetical protein